MFATGGFDSFASGGYGGYSGGYENGAPNTAQAPYTPDVKGRAAEDMATSARKRDMRNESTVPVTIGQLLQAHKRRSQPEQEPLLINGQEASNVTFVAQVTRSETKKISQCFAVSDQRGTIAVEKYFHSESPALRERLAAIQPGAYVRVVGLVRIRTANNATAIYVSAHQVRVVSDPAEVFCHELEAAMAHAKATGMTAGEAQRKSLAARKSHHSAYQSGASQEYRDAPPTPPGASQEGPLDCAPLEPEGADDLVCPVQRAALAVLQLHNRENPNDDYGLTAADITERINYRHSEPDVSDALNGLGGVGHAYETEGGRWKNI